MNACVVDGGALLHKIKWKTKTTYREICQQYTEYLRRSYGQYSKVCIVFDGYSSESTSTKAHEHHRRQDGGCPDIQVTFDADVTTTSERFLRNSNNKQKFIKLLSTELESNGYKTLQSLGDADVLIVQTAMEYCSYQSVIVSADDTDILVLLMYHMRPEYHEVFFATKSGKKVLTWNIKNLCEAEEMSQHLLFIHAWTGCDTTSAVHNKGN